MKENQKSERISKRGELPEEKRPPDPELLKLKKLLQPFNTEGQKRVAMKHIEEYTHGTVSVVVENWLNGKHIPSPAIRKGIISALESFPLDSLPVENIPVIATKEKTGENPLPKKQSTQRIKRDDIIKANERQLEIMQQRAEEKRNQNRRIKSDEEHKVLMEKLRKEGKIV